MGSLNTYTAQAVVSAGSTVESRHEFQRDAVVTGASIRTYLGQEFSLLTRVSVHTSEGRVNHLVEPGSAVNESYPNAIGGDDTDYDLHFREEVEQGDELVIEFINTDSNNTYHGDVTVQFDEDYAPIARLSQLLGQVI